MFVGKFAVAGVQHGNVFDNQGIQDRYGMGRYCGRGKKRGRSKFLAKPLWRPPLPIV